MNQLYAFLIVVPSLMSFSEPMQEEYEEDDDEYGEANAEGGLTGSSDTGNGGGGGGDVDLLSMDELTVSDPTPPAAAAMAPTGDVSGLGGGMADLFGVSGAGGGVAAPQGVQKQVWELKG